MSESAAKTVTAYIHAFPKNVQVILQQIRRTIIKTAPKATESISYGMVGYKLNGRPLVYFGGWKTHVGLYALPSGTAAFKKELTKYKTSKGSIQFQLTEPVPYGLIKKIVLFRTEEVAAIKKRLK